MTRARWKAVLLSLGLPGLGEMYAGEQRSAVLTLMLWHVMLVFSVALVSLALPGPLIVLPFLLGIVTWIVVAVRAARAAARAPQPYTLQPYDRWYWYGVAILFSLLVWQPTLLRYIKAHWVQAFQIPSTSMEPTILSGDFIFVSKRPSGPLHRNDIVVYESPSVTGIMMLKRIVGVGGDTLAMRDGVLILDGDPVAEPFTTHLFPSYRVDTVTEGRRWQLQHLVSADPQRYHPDMRNWGPIVVPRDSVFILGDNRDDSYDSRFWGALGADRVRGRPLYVYFSKSRDANMGLSIRWNRIGVRF
jgi:signal peptidase I